MSPTLSLKELPSLDGVRGIAILMVLAHNLTILDGANRAPARFVELVLNFGWAGVQLFFVLSGFLISRILLQTRSSPNYYQSFFVRRILRIFPLYYAALLILLVVLPALQAMPEYAEANRHEQTWLWFYLVNWTEPFRSTHGPLAHFWSLAVEEQFYLVWPFVVYRCTPAKLVQVSLAISVGALLIRIAMRVDGAPSEAVYMFTICRMDALALGATAAALTQMPVHWKKIIAFRGWLWVVAAGLFAAGAVISRGLYPRSDALGQTAGYSILALVFMFVILAAVATDQIDAEEPHPRALRVLRWPVLRVMGKYSYGIYIIHWPLHDLLGKPWLESHGLRHTTNIAPATAYLAIGIGLSLALAMLIYHGFEVHFLALKRYFVATPP